MLDIIIFVPYNLFRLFLVHKISNICIYMKIGKRNGKKEKGKEFPANWAEEEILAQRARVRAWAGGPAGSRRSGTAQAGVVGVGPRASERVVTASGGGPRR